MKVSGGISRNKPTLAALLIYKIGQCFLFFVISKWIFQVLFHPEVPGGGCAPIDSLLGRDLSGFTQQESTLFLGKRLGILAGKKALDSRRCNSPLQHSKTM